MYTKELIDMNKSYTTKFEEHAKNYYNVLLGKKCVTTARKDLKRSIKAAIKAGESAEHINDRLSDIALSMC
jgi:hypothetical protein